MAIKTRESGTGTITFIISDNLDFSIYSDFKKTCIDNIKESTEYEFDLSEVTYMDSAGLGMLLIF